MISSRGFGVNRRAIMLFCTCLHPLPNALFHGPPIGPLQHPGHPLSVGVGEVDEAIEYVPRIGRSILALVPTQHAPQRYAVVDQRMQINEILFSSLAVRGRRASSP